MSQTVELPDAVYSTARILASRHGVSVEDFLTLAINERSSIQDETDRFFEERMKRAVPGAWRATLAAIPDRPADPHDAKE